MATRTEEDTELEIEQEEVVDDAPLDDVVEPRDEQEEREVAQEEGQEEATTPVYSLTGDKPKAKEVEDRTPAPQWVKDLRRDHKEALKKIRELEQKAQPIPEELQSKPRPSLKDFDFDEEKHAEAVVNKLLI